MSGADSAVLVGLVFALLAVCLAIAGLRREQRRRRNNQMMANRLDRIVDELKGIGDDLGEIRRRGDADAPVPVDLYRD